MFFKKLILTLVVISTIISLSIPAFAVSAASELPPKDKITEELDKQISALLDQIKTLHDALGVPGEIEEYEYVPLRLVAEAADCDVIWRGSDKPILIIGSNHRVVIGDCLFFGGRAHVRLDQIPFIIGGNAEVEKIGNYMCRISISFSDKEAKRVENAIISKIDNDECLTIIYSDGNAQQSGGEGIVKIEIILPVKAVL